jgi:hypothetical protein
MIKIKKSLSKFNLLFIIEYLILFSRENIRQIRIIFVHLHALDHALQLTNQYEIK